MGRTLVSFHAHPDDEVLLTGGTLALLAAQGHRVVIAFATDGAEGLVAKGAVARTGLAAQRRAEATAAAAALGCDVRFLGFDDSGMDGRAGRPGSAFSRVPTDTAADRLADLLAEVDADALTVYDAAGGYGHPDHVAVHHVGIRAAERVAVRSVFEATVDRSALVRALRWGQLLPGAPADWHPSRFTTAYTAHVDITHRVDVREHIDAKRAAMAAHATQATADDGSRTLATFLRLPRPVFRRVFGREWFVERGRSPSGAVRCQLFDRDDLGGSP